MAYLDSLLTNVDWALGRIRAMMPTGQGRALHALTCVVPACWRPSCAGAALSLQPSVVTGRGRPATAAWQLGERAVFHCHAVYPGSSAGKEGAAQPSMRQQQLRMKWEEAAHTRLKLLVSEGHSFFHSFTHLFILTTSTEAAGEGGSVAHRKG